MTNLGLLYLAHRPSRIFLYFLFTFVEYLLFAWILFNFIKNKTFKKFITISSVVFVVFLLIYDLFFKPRGLDSIPIGVETILVMIVSFYYFYEQMNDTSELFIYTKYSFWLVLGMLIYLAGSFFIYIFATQLSGNNELAKYWIFTNIFSILKNLFFTIAIVVHAYPAPKKNEAYSMYHLN